MTLYLIHAGCPWCGSVPRLVEQRDEPVPLMQDVEIVDTFNCPHCGETVHRSEWDVHESAEIERVEPSD